MDKNCKWEINVNLNDSEKGLSNFHQFSVGLNETYSYFIQEFGPQSLDGIRFYVDNATANSGPTPITTPVFGEFFIVKLCINFDNPNNVYYQFAHELMHLVFWSYYGMSKPFANEIEESICTAVSLVVINHFFPSLLKAYEASALRETREGYRKGPEVARNSEYNLKKLYERMKSVYRKNPSK